jgi:tetratricopeptide (TPR) repeat protein
MAMPGLDEEAIFHAARQIRTPEGRRQYLAQCCGDDTALQARLEALLRVHDEEQSFLQSPVAELRATVDVLPVREGPGTVLGPYKLLEQIGEGGFGTVFLAEQQQPVRRQVALKVLKPGMDTRQVIARFEAERQALALMDHPHIARVLDAGATASGRPYFVMELVRGIAITEYCDQGQLSVQERLQLFVPVCQAVQHAHQKGIIHRDLKPSNLLVTLHDDTPSPYPLPRRGGEGRVRGMVKVIDFGIAKATGQQLTDKTLVTGITQLLGTPLYMSPEQAALGGLDVDTRSDIYSLGVVLYELLTGTTPFARQRFQEVGYDEMRRIIREEEPPRPSMRLREEEFRPTRRVGLSRFLPFSSLILHPSSFPELDWIVMKCLEKDRNRRYDSANGLARDIERYLHNEPVQACPPSAWYRYRKFARRNKTGLTIAGLVVLFLGLLVGAVGWLVRDQAAREQEVARDRAAQQAATEREGNQALEEAATLQRQKKWPEALEVAKRAEGVTANGGSAALRQRAGELRRDLEMVLLLEDIRLRGSDVRDGHFNTMRKVADYEDAFREYGIDVVRLDPQAGGEELRTTSIPVELAAALDDWALERRLVRKNETGWKNLLALARRADPDEWRNQVRDALEREDSKRLQQLGASERMVDLPPSTLVFLGMALEESGAVEQAAAVLRKAQQRHPGDFWVSHELASALMRLKSPPLEDVVRFQTAALALRPRSPGVYLNLGIALAKKGAAGEALAAYKQALHLKPDYAEVYSDLGVLLRDQGQALEAEAACRKALDLRPDFAGAYANLGTALLDQGKLLEAEAACRKALALQSNFAEAYSDLGEVLQAQKKFPDAEAAYRKAIDLRPDLAVAHANLGVLLRARGRLAEAEASHRKALELRPDDARIHCNLGNALLSQGKVQEAEAAFRKAVQLRPDDAVSFVNLGVALREQKRLPEAEAALRKATQLQPDLAEAHDNLGSILHDQRKLPEAEAAIRKAIELRPNLAAARHNLGVVLRDRGKLPEAEAAFRKAIELRPDYALAHHNLGNILQAQRKLPEAEAALRKALELQPDDAASHCNLGGVLQAQGKLTAALAELRRGDELGSRQRGWTYPSPQWVKNAERLVALDARLPSVLSGQAQPADAAEQLGLAQLCQKPYKRLHAASARFYVAAFAAQPRLADDVPAGHRHDAACAAALAGCGQGDDRPSPDAKERGRWRQQALDWLRADLAWWRQRVETGQAQDLSTLRRWLEDPDLAGVRGEPALAQLPEAEREPWRRLWADVADALGKTPEKTGPEDRPRKAP